MESLEIVGEVTRSHQDNVTIEKRNARRAFITEVKLRRQENINFETRFNEVRQNHKSLLEVVDVVGQKSWGYD